MFAAVAALAVLIPVASYIAIVRRAREVQLLTTRGVTRQALVTEKVYRVKGGIFRGITYAFEDAGGHRHRKFIAMASTEDTGYTEGGMVDIVYVQDDPRINSLKSIVDRTRAAHAGSTR
jgi:hypothetical protein